MAEYQSDRTTIADDRSQRSGVGTIAIVVAVFALIVGVLFASGYWSMDVKQAGSAPTVTVSTAPGQLPKVNVISKEIVVGAKEATVEVPTVDVKKN